MNRIKVTGEEYRAIIARSEANREFWDTVGVRFKESFDIDPYFVQYVATQGENLGVTLDFCCGAGRNLLHLLENGVNVSGFDFSRESIDHAREKAREINPEYPAEDRIREATMYEANRAFPGQSFDTVLAYAVLYENAFNGFITGLEQADNFVRDGGNLFVMMRTEPKIEPEKVTVIEREEHYTTLEHNYNGTTRVYMDPDYFIELVEGLGYTLQQRSDPFAFGSRGDVKAVNFVFSKDVSRKELELIVSRS